MNLDKLKDTATEEALLGAVILNPSVISELNVPMEAFADDSRRAIWAAIMACHSAGDDIDILTVANKLSLQGKLDAVGGLPYITQLTYSVPSSLHARTYAARLIDLARRRLIIQALTKIANDTVNTDRDPSYAAEVINSVLSFGQSGNVITLASAMANAAEHAAKLQRGEVTKPVIFGVPTIDKMLHVDAGEYIVVGARPSTGKTALLLTTAIETARRGKGVIFVSLEMSELELGQRAISILSGVPLELLRRGKLSDEQWNAVVKATTDVEGWDLYVVHAPGANVTAIKAETESIINKSKSEVSLVLIDYLGLIVGQGNSEYEAVTSVSKELQRFARSLNKHGAALIVAHQLNRGPTQRAEKRPVMADLRSSGQIEQDADVIMLLWRPDDEDEAAVRRVNVYMAKVRQGESNYEINCALDKRTTRIVELQDA